MEKHETNPTDQIYWKTDLTKKKEFFLVTIQPLYYQAHWRAFIRQYLSGVCSVPRYIMNHPDHMRIRLKTRLVYNSKKRNALCHLKPRWVKVMIAGWILCLFFIFKIIGCILAYIIINQTNTTFCDRHHHSAHWCTREMLLIVAG